MIVGTGGPTIYATVEYLPLRMSSIPVAEESVSSLKALFGGRR